MRPTPQAGPLQAIAPGLAPKRGSTELAISRDATHVAHITAGHVQVWSIPGPRDPLTLREPGFADVLDAAFIDDGSGIVTIAADATFRIWSTSALLEATVALLPPAPDKAPMSGAAIGPNGRVAFPAAGVLRVHVCVACQSL